MNKGKKTVTENMNYIMKKVSLQAKTKIFNKIDELKKGKGSYSIIDEEDYQRFKEEELNISNIEGAIIMDKEEALRFFKCYRSEVSCIDCEYKEPCNVFVYVKQQIELDTPSTEKLKEGKNGSKDRR